MVCSPNLLEVVCSRYYLNMCCADGMWCCSACSTLWQSQHCGTTNPPAQSILRQSQHCSTINPLAQSPFWLNIVAQSTIQHIHHSSTVNCSAQSTIWHYHHCGTRFQKHPDTPLHNSMIDARLVHSARIIIVLNC